jgi:hypothetical protein
VVREIGALLKARLERDELEKRVGRGFTNFDFRAVCAREGWKRAERNQFHLHLSKPDVRRYSDEAVNAAVDAIVKDSDYLSKARASYSHSLKKLRNTPGRT